MNGLFARVGLPLRLFRPALNSEGDSRSRLSVRTTSPARSIADGGRVSSSARPAEILGVARPDVRPFREPLLLLSE